MFNLLRTLFILIITVQSYVSHSQESTNDHLLQERGEVVLERELGLDDYEKVARLIIHVQRSMSKKFPVGDSLTLSLYIMHVFAQIGDYRLTQAEILDLMDVFIRLTKLSIPDTVREIIDQIASLDFATRDGKISVLLNTTSPMGFYIPVGDEEDRVGVTADRPANQGLDFVHIPHRTIISFQELSSSAHRTEITDFMKEQFKFPLLPASWFSSMNQIYPRTASSLSAYLNRESLAKPLRVSFQGPKIRVDAGKLLGQLDLEFQDAYLTPGLKDAQELALPSFHIWARQRLVKIKTSLAL
jgi:hypothetical protein